MEDREKSFYTFTTTRPVAIAMMVLAVFTFGLLSLKKLPVELLPPIDYPTLTVRTEYPGAGPEDVEERVSRRIQEALSVLPGLKEISSISKTGLSDVTLEFTWGTHIPFATQNIREKLDRTLLPEDVGTPIILRYDPTLDPVIRIGVSGGEDLAALRKLVEDEIQRRLESVEGVAAVKVRGGLEEEIRVEVDRKKLRALNLTLEALNQRLAAENVNMAAGTIKEGDTEYLVRTLNQFMDLDEIMRLVVARTETGVIRLGSLATVRRSYKERDIISRIDGRESVEIQVFKEAGANIVSLADRVKARLLGTPEQRAYAAALAAGRIPDPERLLAEARRKKERERAEGKGSERESPLHVDTVRQGHRGGPRGSRSRGKGLAALETDPELVKLQAEVDAKKRKLSFIAADLPPNVRVRVLSDQSRFIRDAINEVRSTAVLGGFFAVLVLYLFLRRFTSTLIIALSIPISVVATFAPMFLSHTSLNIMSLGGLALGVGMLVDNSIIVLESIFRCREEGDARTAAALRGVGEIGGAAVASTLTTVAVFFPIVFVEGLAGQIFRDQALTVVFSLLTSLAVALFFIPMLASRKLAQPAAGPGAASFRFTSPRRFREGIRGGRTFPGRAVRTVFLLLPLLLHLAVEVLGWILFHLFRGSLGVGIRLFGAMARFLHLLLSPVLFLFDLAFRFVTTLYPPLLRFVLINRPAATVLLAATAVLVYAAAQRARSLGQEILPEVHQGELIARVALHNGAPLEQTDRVVARVDREALALGDVDWVSSTVGVARDEIAGAEEGAHTGKVYVKLHGREELARLEERVLAELRRICASHPEILSFRFTRPTLFSFKAPIQVEVKGINLDAIRAAAREVEEILRRVPGLEDVKSTVQRGNPEIRIRFDREKLARFSLDPEALARRISDMVKGRVPTRFLNAEHKIDILVKADERRLASVEDLASMVVNPQAEAPLPLEAVADIRVVEGPGEIRRIWGQRAAVVSANLSRFDMGGTAERISAALAPIRDRTGLTVELGGQGRELGEVMQNMKLALALAVFLVYLVMASQFESFYQPFIIICTIPLAFVGVVFTLSALHVNISVIVFIGAIMLAGIVVNNAIVLIDYINRMRRRGLEKTEAIVQACRVRLRPILMTTTTTVLGLVPLTGVLGYLPLHTALPLGLGEGVELRAPLAITVISGLVSSTILTLIIIPLVYSLTEALFHRGGPGRRS